MQSSREGGETNSKKKMCMLIMQYRFLVFQLSINILQVSYNKKEKNKLKTRTIYIYIYIVSSPVKTLKTIFRSSHFEKFCFKTTPCCKILCNVLEATLLKTRIESQISENTDQNTDKISQNTDRILELGLYSLK